MNNLQWWQRGIIYQIYPFSWMDTDANGFGDLPGIIRQLAYLRKLGVTALWLCPVYPSPLSDYGYDVADYKSIHSYFGSMRDFDTLLSACHSEGLRLILDFIPNHTSDKHPWFEESRSSLKNPKRDWYLWKEAGLYGRTPNNWLSVFGGSAWEWDSRTRQYYYHAFSKKQPDLNWRNPEVQEAMFDVMRFWLDKGVDGFRVDVVWHLIKDEQFRDNPTNPDYWEGSMPSYQKFIPAYSTDQPEVHVIAARMRGVVEEYGDKVLIGEVYLPLNQLIMYYGQESRRGVHLPYNFQLGLLPWRATDIYAGINNYEASLPSFAWPNWVIGNHDKPRVVTRLGLRQARVAGMLLLTLRGTPILYYGDEIGMQNSIILPAQMRDPVAEVYPEEGRDPERSPMQWSPRENAGFTTAPQPWLPVNQDYRDFNVECEERDHGSFLNFYRRLIRLRQQEAALRQGLYRPAGEGPNAFAFSREHEDGSFLIAVNLSSVPTSLSLTAPFKTQGEVVLSTDSGSEGNRIRRRRLELGPDEGIIIRMTN